MTCNSIRLGAILGLLMACSVLRGMAAEPESLGGGWKHQDVGAVQVPGSATLEQGVFTLKGTLDIWGTNDGFHMVLQPFKGDGQIIARVVSVENTAGHAKAGVTFRESLAPGAKHATACVTPVDGTQFLARADTNGKTTSAKTGLNRGVLPYWIKLVRAGDQFGSFESTDGEHWTQIGATNVVMSREVFVGLTASSHQATKLCAATLDKVAVTPK